MSSLHHSEFSHALTRREALLQAAACLSPTLVASSSPRVEVAEQQKPIGWAIVGLGTLSLNEILPGFAQCRKSKPVAVVSGSPDKAKQTAEKYAIRHIYHYENYDSIKDNPEIDAVYIVLPNGMHAEYTVRAHQAGKHVLCEKPMANTPQECEKMIEAAKAANKKLMIAYRCRYEPFNKEAIEICRSGEIGKLKVIVADHGFRIGDPTQWRLTKKLGGGGSLMDIGIYSLQCARYLSGEEPVEVSAQMFSTPGDPRFKEVEETINFILRFPSGVLANCTSSYGYAGANRVRVLGDEGFLDMEPATAYRGLRLRTATRKGWQDKKFEETSHFALEMDHFAECIATGRNLLTPGEEGLRDLKTMMAIYEAARSGKTVKLA